MSIANPELIGSVRQSSVAVFSRPIDNWFRISGRVTPESDVTTDLCPLGGSTRLSFNLRLCPFSADINAAGKISKSTNSIAPKSQRKIRTQGEWSLWWYAVSLSSHKAIGRLGSIGVLV